MLHCAIQYTAATVACYCHKEKEKKKKEKSVTYSNEILFSNAALWIKDEIYVIWRDVL